MQKSGTPVESKKNAEPRDTDNRGVTINVNAGSTDDTGKRRLAKPKTEQPKDTTTTTEDTQLEEAKPPLYDKHQRLTSVNGDRTNRFATPLASTLFSRFDPDHTGVQPAEHYTYVDRQYLIHGRL